MHDVVVGKNSVLELLRSGNRKIERILIARNSSDRKITDEILDFARKNKIRCEFVPRRQLQKFEGKIPHQGIVAFVLPISYQTLAQLTDRLNFERPPLLLMLDGVEDSRNFGAIIRTAEAVAVDGIIIPKRRSASVTTGTHKASAGSIEHIQLVRVANLVQSVDRLKKIGFWVIGSDGNADVPYTGADFTSPICLILGGEAKGISRLLREKCDSMVRIPMFGKTTSLNVSVATGILLYEVARQRGDF